MCFISTYIEHFELSILLLLVKVLNLLSLHLHLLLESAEAAIVFLGCLFESRLVDSVSELAIICGFVLILHL